MFKKLFLVLFLFIAIKMPSNAAELSSSINEILNSFDFDKDSIVSISVKDKKTGMPVYEKHAYKYLNPASTLKLFTMAASIDTLGKDFKFETAFYLDKYNNLYLKLSGDPMFTSEDMGVLAKNLKKAYKGKINKIFIDDLVMDMVPYPDGWTIDDYWPNAPKISPYMVDNNTVKVDFYLSEDKNNIKIIQKDPYKFSFVNKLITGHSNTIALVEDDTHNTINVLGTISSNVLNKEVPVLNPKYFFCQNLNEALNKNGVIFSDKFLFGKTPNEAKKIASFDRSLDEVIKHTLETSDNTAAEMVFKVAGGKYASENSPLKSGIDSFGTSKNGINMFYDYFKRIGLDTNQVKLRDGSGVSRYNVMNANWMTNAINKMDFNYSKYLPTADEGTLSRRMRELKGDVYFKTGTLFGLSSLAGIIKTSGREYSYTSIIMSYNRNKSLIKGIEDEIVYEIYKDSEK